MQPYGGSEGGNANSGSGDYDPFGWHSPAPVSPLHTGVSGTQQLTNRRGNGMVLDHRKSNSMGGLSDTGSVKSRGNKSVPKLQDPNLVSPIPNVPSNFAGSNHGSAPASHTMRMNAWQPEPHSVGSVTPPVQPSSFTAPRKSPAPKRRMPAPIPTAGSNDFFTGYDFNGTSAGESPPSPGLSGGGPPMGHGRIPSYQNHTSSIHNNGNGTTGGAMGSDPSFGQPTAASMMAGNQGGLIAASSAYHPPGPSSNQGWNALPAGNGGDPFTSISHAPGMQPNQNNNNANSPVMGGFGGMPPNAGNGDGFGMAPGGPDTFLGSTTLPTAQQVGGSPPHNNGAAAASNSGWGFLPALRQTLWQDSIVHNPNGGVPLHQMRFGCPEDDLPLYEELGVDISKIIPKMLAVLNPLRSPKLEVTKNNDLAGPIVFAVAIATLLLLQGKMEFSAVYAQMILGAILFRLLLPMLSGATASLTFVVSSLGYGLLPSALLALLRAMQFWLLQRGSARRSLPLPLTVVLILWSAWSASGLMTVGLQLQHQRFLLFYPCVLFYAVFAALTVF